MKSTISSQYALRSLGRHARRTILSILGIGLGCGLCLFVIGFIRGESEMMLRAAAESGVGHFKIAPAEWAETRDNDIRLDGWQTRLDRLRNMEEIEVATPHAKTEGLLAFGTRMMGVELAGVDPDTEQAANRLVRNVTEGRYLEKGTTGTVVVGRTVTKRLNVELDDDLMITVAGSDGEINGAMLRIVGIIETGSRDLDATICQVTLNDLENIKGLQGAAEITVIVKKPKKMERLITSLKEELPTDNAILTWKDIMPEMASGVEVDKTWTRMIVSIIMIVVFLGIASAQLAAVLERRREFAVLAALGMKSGKLLQVMLVEGLVLGLAGAVLGLVFGVPSTYYIATQGIDFSKLYENSDMAFGNILMDPIFYGDFGWWLLPLSFALSLTATILSSLYPAWFAVKTDPASALRVEN